MSNSQPDAPSVAIGIDTGGTFTDLVCRVPGEPDRILKVPSTPSDPSQAVRAAMAELADKYQVAPEQVSQFAHGTTVATNAVLERKGTRTGLIMTEGFKDTLEIGRQIPHRGLRAPARPRDTGVPRPRRPAGGSQGAHLGHRRSAGATR